MRKEKSFPAILAILILPGLLLASCALGSAHRDATTGSYEEAEETAMMPEESKRARRDSDDAPVADK